MLGPSLPITNEGAWTEDHLIAKAFESLRVSYGQRMNFQRFASENWERARLVLSVEGRNTQAVVNALTPFAEAQCSPEHLARAKRLESARRLASEYPHMARMIQKGMT